MASQSNASDQDRPVPSARVHTGLENFLPANITERSRSKSRTRPSATPTMERSISSLTDSFMLDHKGSSSRLRPNESGTPHPPKDNTGLTPISNWAHLTYLKNQRNDLRGELKAHQVAGAEARRSMTSLRRLAFRMAVNISVKEKQIATSARSLASTRKSTYLQGKDAEKRIEELRRALGVEEERNKDILEALESASALTLQYSTPKAKAQHRRQRSPLSPPPSPPTRLSNLPETPLSSPRTPTRPSPSPWHDTDWDFTPSRAEIRTSDSRLIRAKRESDLALAACRNRIQELQSECTRSVEDSRLLAATREGLELEIRSHQTRIATLERSRATAEESLQSTKLQLDAATSSEKRLEQALQAKDMEVADLEEQGRDRQRKIEAIEVEKHALEERLKSCNAQLKEFEHNATRIEAGVLSLQSKLASAERHESSLRDRLAEKEGAREDLRKRLERGLQYVHLLEQKVARYETDAAERSRLTTVDKEVILSLKQQLEESEQKRKVTDDALATLKDEIAVLQESLSAESRAHASLTAELEAMQSAKRALEGDLKSLENRLHEETATKVLLKSELDTLCSHHTTLQSKLQAALQRIQSLQGNDLETRKRLESLRDARSALDADLKDARQTLFRLREDLRTSKTELADVISSRNDLQDKLKESEERVSSLGKLLEQSHQAKVDADTQHAKELEQNHIQVAGLEEAVTNLLSSVKQSEKQKMSLQEKLRRAQLSKATIEEQLGEISQSKIEIQNRFDSIKAQLNTTQVDHDSLQVSILQLENDRIARSQSRKELEAQMDSAQQEIKSLRETISDLKTTLETTHEENTRTVDALTLMQSAREESVIEISSLQDQLHQAKGAEIATNNKLQKAGTSNDELVKQLHVAQSALTELESKARDMQLQESHLESEIVRYQVSNKELESQLESLQNSRDELQAESVSTQSQIHDLEVQVDHLYRMRSTLEEELEAIHRSKSAVEKRLKETSVLNRSLEEKLQIARQSKSETDDQLSKALDDNVRMEAELNLTRTQAHDARIQNADLLLKLDHANNDLSGLQQGQRDIQGRHDEAVETSRDLAANLATTRSRLNDVELQYAQVSKTLTQTNEELTVLQHEKSSVEEQFHVTGNNNSILKTSLETLKLRVDDLESEKASLTSDLSQNRQTMDDLRLAYSKLESLHLEEIKGSHDLNNSLRATQMQLDIAQSEGDKMKSMVHEADNEVMTLRETNDMLETAEKDLIFRLASAEEELKTVRATNAHLESFLEQVESDMTSAEVAIGESEKRLEIFIEESQARLESAIKSKTKYKRLTSEKTKDIEHLTNANSDLHHQIEEQRQELDQLQQGKTRLTEELSQKEDYIEKLGFSSDKRMRSMNSAYNELRKKHAEQLKQQRLELSQDGMTSVNTELQAKDVQIEAMQKDKDQFASSLLALEQEVQTLREDKIAFKKLVATLQEKVRHLEVLEEWQEHTDASDAEPANRVASPGSLCSTQPKTWSRPVSKGLPDTLDERPTTGISSHSREEDLEAWAREVERVRLMRNEKVIQLQDMRKATHDLKKSLKDSKAQLHQLEKQARPTRHRTLLRKSRPSTPQRGNTEPGLILPFSHTTSRPATAGGLPRTPGSSSPKRHSLRLFSSSSTSTPSSPMSRPETRRWSTLPRPATSHRLFTSHSISFGLSERHEVDDTVHENTARPNTKRRWSSRLRNLFKDE